RPHFASSVAPPANQDQQDTHTTTTVHVSLRVDASPGHAVPSCPTVVLPGCGGVAWPAGQVLSTYHKSVVDLGSGTGLVGLVAASLGAHPVALTDQLPLLHIMRANAVLNNLAHRVDVIEYNWGLPKPDALPQRVDLVLAADCIYLESTFPLLVATLCDLVANNSNGEPEILLCL
ncbi:hypothetical protein EW145_g2905, partial [Phellinidium pouzarii]